MCPEEQAGGVTVGKLQRLQPSQSVCFVAAQKDSSPPIGHQMPCEAAEASSGGARGRVHFFLLPHFNQNFLLYLVLQKC